MTVQLHPLQQQGWTPIKNAIRGMGRSLALERFVPCPVHLDEWVDISGAGNSIYMAEYIHGYLAKCDECVRYTKANIYAYVESVTRRTSRPIPKWDYLFYCPEKGDCETCEISARCWEERLKVWEYNVSHWASGVRYIRLRLPLSAWAKVPKGME